MSAEERNRYRARGWAIAAAVVVPFWLISGGLLFAAVSTQAEPNEETLLPSGGVISITRAADTWTVTTTGAASEIKYMGPGAQQIICGTNYGDPCTTVESFTAAGDCVYLQLDGVPGENSSDPYVCRGGTSSTSTPVETEPVPTSVAPTPTTEPFPSPTPSSTNSPTSTPEPSSSTNPITPVASTAVDGPTSTKGGGTTNRVPVRLADTGRHPTIWDLAIVMGATTLIGLGLFGIARRANP